MKLSCLQNKLNYGLNVVGKAAASRTTLPITNNVLLSTEQSRIKLAATNLEMAISCWVDAKVEEEGAITVPARLLTEFVSSLPNEPVDMNLNKRGNSLKVTCSRFEAKISGIEAKDFPPIPQLEDGVTTSINAEVLRQSLSKVTFASALDESRPVLTGVNASFKGNSLTLASADGFRLAVCTLPLVEPVPNAIKINIPAKTLNELNRLISNDEETIKVLIDTHKSQVLFRFENIEIVSQLIQGSFPAYEQLIPQSYTTKAIIDTQAFQMATKTAAIFARDGGGIVRLVASPGGKTIPGKLIISARSEEIGEDTGEIDADISGEEAKIAFNGKYLTDVLNVIHEQQTSLEITGPSSPGVIKPVGATNYIHVIMPMFVQW